MAAWSLVTLSLAQLSKRRYPNYSLFVRQSSCSTKDKPVLRNQRLQYCMIMCRVGNILAAVVRMLLSPRSWSRGEHVRASSQNISTSPCFIHQCDSRALARTLPNSKIKTFFSSVKCWLDLQGRAWVFSGMCLLMLCLPGAAPSNAPGFHARKHTSYHSLLFSPCRCHPCCAIMHR